MDLTQKARDIFSNDKYATGLTGIVIEHVDNDHVECSLSLRDVHRNAKGAIMGGVLFTLADFVFAIAANSQILSEGNEPQWVSTSSTIHFLSQCKGDRLIAISNRIRQGKRNAVFHISINDSLDNQVAIVIASGTRV
ncbi:MAG: PaaI family thioesterase [Bacteroidales bacterium]|nr:PaaI family thioesterase [Bacteroidales bacterium]